jgi:hypothetical protein
MRGGKRPGAGAPKGNMNNLKHGGYSKQFAEVGALLAQDPNIREALLALARKHNLRQRKANEVAALLFTRLFQRAENIAGGRLNLHLPADEHDSIKLAAAQAARRQLRSAIRQATKRLKKSDVNQTPDTRTRGQSE